MGQVGKSLIEYRGGLITLGEPITQKNDDTKKIKMQ